MERAFATAPATLGETNASAVEGSHLLGGSGGVQRALETFATSVGGEGGLSGPRLLQLASGLARCADGDFREAAGKCQVTGVNVGCSLEMEEP